MPSSAEKKTASPFFLNSLPWQIHVMLCLHLFLALLPRLMYFQASIAVVILHTTQKHLSLSPAADAINNAAGFGFNGYNKDGSPRWDLISNLKILDIEVRLFFVRFVYPPDSSFFQLKPNCALFSTHFQFATSFKMFLDNWNIQTALWLKR